MKELRTEITCLAIFSCLPLILLGFTPEILLVVWILKESFIELVELGQALMILRDKCPIHYPHARWPPL